MNLVDDNSAGFGKPSLRRDIALWGSAALVVFAAHAGAAWYLTQNAEPLAAPVAAEEAMMIDLTPMLETTPESVESETVSEEEPTEMAAAEEPVETTEAESQETVTPEEQVPIEPESVVEEVTPAEPEIVQPEENEPVEPEPEIAEAEPIEPDVVTEEVIEEPTVALPDSDVPLPVSRPEPREIVRERPREQLKRERPRREQPRQTAQEARPQPKSQASVQQRASSAPRVSPARWNSQAARQIQRVSQRAVRRIRGTGTVVISFSVSASGSVGGVRVSRSSGNPGIDSAVVGAVSGIKLPPPPNGGQSVSIPVHKDR